MRNFIYLDSAPKQGTVEEGSATPDKALEDKTVPLMSKQREEAQARAKEASLEKSQPSKKRLDDLLGDISEGKMVREKIPNAEKTPTDQEIVERLSGVKVVDLLQAGVPAKAKEPKTEEEAKKALELGGGKLKNLFLGGGPKDFVVDFHGHESAKWQVGLGDMFPPSVLYLKVNGVVGKRSVSRGKVGYVDRSGKYLAVLGGEKIALTVSEEERKPMDHIKPLSALVEIKTRRAYVATAEMGEKRREGLNEEYKKLLKEQGINPAEVLPERYFIEASKVLAKKIESDFGIPWQVTVAQASLESGFGKHAPNNNFFGIKAPKGQGAQLMTGEYRNGVYGKERASFRMYGTMADSFHSYAKLLNKPRYRGAFQYKDNPKQFLRAVIAAGYATTPPDEYVRRAESALRSKGLTLEKGLFS